MPSCFICFVCLNSFKDLIMHIKLFHSFENNLEYKCIESSCSRRYNSFDSFSRHLLTHTVGIQEFCNNLHTQPQQIIDTLNCEINEELDIIPFCEIFNEEFKEQINRDAIILISKWYNEAVVPRNKLQILVNDLSGFNDNCMQVLKKEVVHHLERNNCDINSISKISVMFDIINNPFINLKTEYKRLKVLEELGVHIKPIEIAIGSRNKNISKDNLSAKVNICFIPLRCVLKVFFEQPNVLKTVLKYYENLNSMTGEIVGSYVQSEVWKVKCVNNSDKIFIPFFLYFVEYETNNPLGAHAGNKKLGAVYISFGSCLLLNSSLH